MNKMNNQIRYQLLKNIGVPIYKYRSIFNILGSEKLFLTPSCLVLLPYPISELSIQSHKTLVGMLKVLELEDSHICLAWLNAVDQNISDQYSYQSLLTAIIELAPYHVLILGDILSQELLGQFVMNLNAMNTVVKVISHPDIFVTHPEYKKQAFQDLLQLKASLNSDLNSNKNALTTPMMSLIK